MIKKTAYNQSIYDACIWGYGTITKLMDFLLDNDLTADDTIIQGRELIFRDDEGNKKVKTFFLENNIIPVSDSENAGTLTPPTPITPEINTSYTVIFSTDLTEDWAFLSNHQGTIESIDLVNVDSITIDGVAPVFPYNVDFNTTYKFEIVKTIQSNKSIVTFNIGSQKYSNVQELPDFSPFTGRYSYAVDSVNGLCYKVDNDLLTVANTSGVGTWTVNPLIDTLTLPVLPTGGQWNKNILLKDNTILFAGGNTTNKDVYYCILNSGVFYDLNGVVGYSQFEKKISGSPVVFISYDYMQNYVYISDFVYGLYITELNLNDNSVNNYYMSGAFSFFKHFFRKIHFNPYNKKFTNTFSDIDLRNRKNGIYKKSNPNDIKQVFNKKTGNYIASSQKYIAEFNEFGQRLNRYKISSALSYYRTANFTIDEEKNIITSNGGYSNFLIYDLDNLTGGHYNFINMESGFTYCDNGMCAKDNLHLLIATGGKRLQCIDVSESIPNFNYFEFPTVINDLITTRLL